MNIKNIYPLSPLQMGILFHHVENTKDPAYFEQSVFELRKKLNIELLNKSYKKLFERYDILRTLFIYNNVEKPQQVVVDERNSDITYIDFSKLEKDQKEIELQNFCDKNRKKGFDLSKDILFRIHVIDQGDQLFWLILEFHHILMDGWCMSIILQELLQIYNSFENSIDVKLPTVVPYINFIDWIGKQNKTDGLKYWKEYLADLNNITSLPVLGQKRETTPPYHDIVELFLSVDLSIGIHTIAKENNLTPNTIIQSLWGVTLQKYNNTDDVVFGIVVSGRPPEVEGIENMVGLCINTIPCRIKSHKKQTILDLLHECQQKSNISKSYEYLQLSDIQSVSGLGRGLIDHIVTYENYPITNNNYLQEEGKKTVFPLNQIQSFEQTNYKFSITIVPDKNYRIKFNFDTQYYNREFIEGLSLQFENIVKQVILNVNIKIADIDLLLGNDKRKLLHNFNDTKAKYPFDKTLIQLFEEQGRQTPDRIALVFKNEQISYKELNTCAECLGGYLMHIMLDEEQFVGLKYNRSKEMYIAILGILKAGRAYIPIEEDTPPERIRYVLKDSNCRTVLSNSEEPYGGCNIIKVSSIIESRIKYSLDNVKTCSNDPCYVIYTSGSTGRPKGVVVNHRNVVNLISCQKSEFGINEDEIILQFSNISFDASVEQIWLALHSGAKLLGICKEQLLSAEQTGKLIQKHQVTHIHAVPGYLTVLDFSGLHSLRRIISGGDICPTQLLTQTKEFVLYNEYGPTETTVTSIEQKFEVGESGSGSVSIGRPIKNTQVYILDGYNKLQPIAVAGELCISGDGLAMGYLNNPELTSEKYTVHPFETGKLLYRTGDMARWLPEGNIEFFGRIDTQVKIRGFRIELEEIKSILLKLRGIKEAAVEVYEDSDKKVLCAYTVCEKGTNVAQIKNHLAVYLPDYMIPSYFIELSDMPRNNNGKLDRKALPPPQIKAGEDYIPPSSELENSLVHIWSEVLNIPKEKISVQANFFSSGGHSLKAMLLTNKIYKMLNVVLPLREIFVHSTIQSQASQIRRLGVKNFEPIPIAHKQPFYALSSAQKRLYLLQKMNPDSIAYNMPGVISLDKKTELSDIKKAFSLLIQRHESLRTCFKVIDDQPVQIIFSNITFNIEIHRLQECEFENFKIQFIRPFKLENTPLLRVAFLEIDNADNILMIDLHHIICDGVSHLILEQEVRTILNKNSLPTLSLQYKDFSQWQNSPDRQKKLNIQETYWLNRFTGELPVLTLPTDYIRPLIPNNEGAYVYFKLGKELSNAIRSFSSQYNLTLYMYLLAVYNILLSKLSGQNDIIVGSPVAGRNHPDLEGIVGMFVNTLALRNNVDGYDTVLEFMRKIKESTIEAFECQNYQFEDLVEKISVVRNISRNPVFDVMFNLLEKKENNFNMPDNGSKDMFHFKGSAKFDLTLTAFDCEDDIYFSFEYSTQLFKPKTIERYVQYLITLVAEVCLKPDKAISELVILPEIEKRQLLHDFNNISDEYPFDKTIIQLFEEQVLNTPDEIALYSLNKKITYKELDESSNQLAWFIKKKGLSNDLIGIISERKSDVIVGILAVLKSNNAYLPLDPTHPKERNNMIMEDSKVRLILADNPSLLDKNVEYILFDNKEIKKENTNTIKSQCNPQDLAYVIYTSGSTGKPKGAMVKHQNLVNYIWWAKKVYVKNEKVNFPFFTSLAFDLTVTSIFTPLITGNTIFIYPGKEQNVLIEKILNEDNVGIIKLTPSHLKLINSNDKIRFNKNKKLKRLIVGGEELSAELAKEIYLKFNSEIEIYNEYGPTETTVGCMLYQFDIHKAYVNSIPIGRPASNTLIYILDQYLKPVPLNVIGEIYIGGVGVGRGYLNNKKLTKEKFVYLPELTKSMLYKTGDLGKFIDEETILFQGRKDEQVKINGYRIELGEIEYVLLKQTGIKQAVITVYEDLGGKVLCAYIVCEKGINTLQIKEQLATYLPDYMIPSYFIELPDLPLNNNGKLDRKALSPPQIGAGEDYTPPSSELEKSLIHIWSEILNLPKEKISVRANFFSNGGHSLKAMLLINRIHKILNVQLPLRDIFIYSTIQSLASQIRRIETKNFEPIPVANEQPSYPLSSAQKRLYLLQKMNPDSTAYNMPQLISFASKIQLSDIKKVFKLLIDRHENLRTCFKMEGETPVQELITHADIDIEKYHINSNDLENLYTQFIRPFNLEKAPLLRVAFLEIDNADNILIIDMHHIVCDGVSHQILEQEFRTLLNGGSLTPLNLQYKDFSQWQNSPDQQKKLEIQGTYWLNKFSGELPVLNLPTDYARPLILSNEGASVYFSPGKDSTKALRSFSLQHNLTLYMSLLGVYSILLSKLSGQSDVIVGSPVAGRNHPDLEGIVGIFVNTLPLRNKVDGNDSVLEFAKKLREATIEAFENQNYQFEYLVEKISVVRDISRNPVFDVMFNLLDQKENSLEIPDNEPNKLIHIKGSAKFDLTLTAVDHEEDIYFSFEYCTQLFKPETIERYVQYFTVLVAEICLKPDKTISELAILPKTQKQQLLHNFNDTKAKYPFDKTLIQLFEEQGRQTPDRIALVFKNEQISYKELNTCAECLGGYLMHIMLDEEQFVGLKYNRSKEMYIAILGILKAGRAYIPIEEDTPPERIRYILKDSNCRTVLSNSEEPYGGCNIIKVSSIIESRIKYSLDNVKTCSNDPCYVIYTSGSTGRPKGVVVNHRNVVNLISCQKSEFGINEDEIILQFSNISFDASVEQIWLALHSGAKLLGICKEQLLSAEQTGKLIQKHQVTHIHAVPGYLTVLDFSGLHSLRRIISGGDICPTQLLTQTKEFVLYNKYGPTETTVTSIEQKFEVGESGSGSVSIGRPIKNTQVYILDGYNKLQPIAVAGELCISGDGLAMGYLNNPELTSEKYTVHPFETGKLLYRTGDMARWLPEGNIEFLGRMDDQVKIRGYRIELGEIENALLKNNNIIKCVVTTRKNNDSIYLCGYVVLKQDQSLESIRDNLVKSLPEYMIPAHFMKLDKIPLMSNGKIDKKSLPSPDYEAFSHVCKAPRNKKEKILTSVWQKVLGIEKIGISDNYFSLGGDSIKSILIVSKLRQYNLKLEVKQLLGNPQIQILSKYVSLLNPDKSQLADFKKYDSISSHIFKIKEDLFKETTCSYSGKVNMPLAKRLKHPTIETIANPMNDERSTNTSHHYLELLKKGDDATKNIFIIHDESGEVYRYIDYCNLFKGNINYWGIRADNLKKLEPTNFSLEYIAEIYLNEIKKVQSGGEYRILGYSLGGLIAFELARKLEQKNAKVFLGIIDIDAPLEKNDNRHLVGAPKKLENGLLKEFTVDSDFAWLNQFLWENKNLGKFKNYNSQDIFWLGILEILINGCDEEILKKRNVINLGKLDINDYTNVSLEELIKQMNFKRSLERACQNYNPNILTETTINYYKSHESVNINVYKWKDYSTKELIIHDMDINSFLF